jgi:hypothetical protein
MKTNNLHLRKWSLLIATLFFVAINAKSLSAQQNIINNKDNTRPETNRQYNSFNITDFKVIQQNGYNEVQWMAPANDDGHRFIVEYSYDGVNFISGQRVLSNSGMYNFKHYIKDTRPLLYRVRTETVTGSLTYSGAILPQGIPVEPVQIQKNVVSGNVVNVNAQFPVERVTITSSEGFQQFAKDINGQRDFIPIAIPSLNRGVYFITFYGNGWKSTSRIVVG